MGPRGEDAGLFLFHSLPVALGHALHPIAALSNLKLTADHGSSFSEATMYRLRLFICLALLGCGAAVADIQGQIPSAGPCYTIEKYPDAAKRPIFAQFVKDARSLTDKSAQLIADGRIADLYSENRAGFAFGNTAFTTREAFLKAYADMEQRIGKVLKVKYRGQGMAISHRGRGDDDIYSTTIYAIKTTKQKKGAYLDIRTIPGEKGQLVFSVWLEHFFPTSPDWLTFGKGEGTVCEEG